VLVVLLPVASPRTALVFGSIGNAAQYGKRLRAIDALVCQAQRRLMAAKPLKSRVERFRAKWMPVRVKKTRQIKNLELRF
jgi:hypothetical protein